VEAGLRSHNRAMREEHTRVAVDHLANERFCPTATAVTNLAAEGIVDGVHHVGDVMCDAALAARAAIDATPSDLLDRLGVEPGAYAVATVHRAETTDDPERLRAVIAYLNEIAADVPVVFPVHPRTAKALEAAKVPTESLTTVPPLGYLDMTRVVARARAVYTDSGGLQKESYFHRVPCVTLRAETEWTETIDAGWNRLWTVPEYASRREITDYGEGDAGGEIAKLVAARFAT
jgi:UDP-GlcNAc3NAcA epimerase